MPINRRNKSPDIDIDPGAVGLGLSKPQKWCVILDGVESEIETSGSFAIKFSILASVPVTKVKHIMKNLPATLWTGRGKSKALNLLELIKEAGGRGRVVEDDIPDETVQPAGSRSDDSSKKSICRKCGFPLKKDDTFCSFCMTTTREMEHKTYPGGVMEKKSPIPAYRYFFFLFAALVALILFVVFR